MSGLLLDDPEPPPRRWIPWAWAATALLVAGATAWGVLATGSAPKAAPQPRPLPVPTASPGCQVFAGPSLPGLGQPFWEWEAHHTAAFDTAAGGGTRWDADPRLPPYRGHEGATYNSTRIGHCLGVSATFIELPAAVDQRTALRRALRLLPSDAHAVMQHVAPACSDYRVTSHTLLGALKARDRRYPGTTGARVQLIFAHRHSPHAINAIWMSIDYFLNPEQVHRCHFRPT